MPKKAMEILTESMFYVLMAFCSGEVCGIDVAAFVEKQTRRRLVMGPATLYTLLAKFLKEGYIVERAVDGRKRTYALTEKGSQAYQDELNRLRLCVADAEAANKEVQT